MKKEKQPLKWIRGNKEETEGVDSSLEKLDYEWKEIKKMVRGSTIDGEFVSWLSF